MDDHSIITLLWERSESALTMLAQRFGQRLLATARNILDSREDAEETVSDTYLAIWNCIPPDKPQPLSPFVYRIGRNLALKRYRDNSALKRRSRFDLSLDELAGCIPGPCMEEDFDARELGRLINDFLGTVSSDNRRIFLRRYWFGDSVTEIAAAFTLTPNTVSVRLNRIRNQLRSYLHEEGYYE